MANNLAAHGQKLSLGSHYFEKALDVCMIPLRADFVGIRFPRRSSGSSLVLSCSIKKSRTVKCIRLKYVFGS